MNASVPERPSTRRGGKFPRGSRLLRHADFERVYKQGRRHFSQSMTVFYLARQEAKESGTPTREISGPRIGFTVGRALGGAVERNRIKRRLREAVRLSSKPEKTNVDVVINPKKIVLKAEFESILNEVGRALTVIEQKLGPRTDESSRTATKPGPEKGN